MKIKNNLNKDFCLTAKPMFNKAQGVLIHYVTIREVDEYVFNSWSGKF